MIVSIQGNIGSGKSAVLASLSERHDTFPEDLESWSPWLRLFYEDMERLKKQPGAAAPGPGAAGAAAGAGGGRRRSLGLQLKVLSSFRRIGAAARRAAARRGAPALVERSPVSSREVFVHLAAERGDLDPHELALYGELHDALAWKPHFDIYLRCSPRVALQRIRKRDRPGEGTIDLRYIESLHRRHEEIFGTAAAAAGGRCIVIDADRPLAEVCAEVRSLVCPGARRLRDA